MEKTAYLALKAKHTTNGVTDWVGFNADPEVVAAKGSKAPKAPKAPKAAKTAKPSKGNGPVVVRKASEGGYMAVLSGTAPTTPKELAPVAPAPRIRLANPAAPVRVLHGQPVGREANVATLLRSIADLLEGK